MEGDRLLVSSTESEWTKARVQWDFHRAQPGVAAPVCSPGAQEAEPEGLLQLEGQAGLHSKYQTKPVLKTGSVWG